MDHRKKSKHQPIAELQERRERIAEPDYPKAECRGKTDGRIETQPQLMAQLCGVMVGFIETDQEGRITLCNPKVCEMFGYELNELLGLQIEALVPDSLREVHIEHRRDFLSDPAPRPLGQGRDIWAQRKDGTQFPVEIGLGLYEVSGEPHLVCFIADITERKRTEVALKINLDRLRLLRQLDQAILAAQSPEAIAQAALEHMKKLIPYEQASIVMFDYGANEFVVLAAQGIDDRQARPGSRFPLHEIDIPEHFPRGRGEMADDVSDLSLPPCPFQVLNMQGMNSYINVPLLPEEVLFGALIMGSSRHEAFSEEQAEIAWEVADGLAIAIQQTWLFERVRSGRDRLQRLACQLVDAQEAERKHIARELHDEVGQLLTGLKLTLEGCMSMPLEESRRALGEAEELVSELLGRLRELSLDLHPAMLDDLGLLQTLLWHFESYTARTGIAVDFEHSGLEMRFPPAVEIGSYRIVQEALTNVARHADVDEVKVKAYSSSHFLGVQIEDKGRGFDPKSVMTQGITSGLAGMRERATALGGTLAIESTPGEYTRLMAELPLNGHLERRAVERET